MLHIYVHWLGHFYETEKYFQYIDLLKKYRPESYYGDLGLILEELVKEGCGYSSAVATVLMHMHGKGEKYFHIKTQSDVRLRISKRDVGSGKFIT